MLYVYFIKLNYYYTVGGVIDVCIQIMIVIHPEKND